MTHILGLLLWGNKWWAHGQLLKRTRRRNYSVPIVYLPKTGTCQIFACTQWTKIGNSILKFFGNTSLGNTKTLLRLFFQAICTSWYPIYQVNLIIFMVWNFEKIRSKVWTWKKQSAKKGSLLFKKKRGSLAFSTFLKIPQEISNYLHI